MTDANNGDIHEYMEYTLVIHKDTIKKKKEKWSAESSFWSYLLVVGELTRTMNLVY